MDKYLKNKMLDYCNDKPTVDFTTVKNLLIDAIEAKNLNNETLIISEIANDLINIRQLVQNKQRDEAKRAFDFLESKLNNL